jgi:hypothetical protein
MSEVEQSNARRRNEPKKCSEDRLQLHKPASQQRVSNAAVVEKRQRVAFKLGDFL